MEINNHNIKGVIFDLDGTLLNSTHIWKDVDKNFFSKRNMEVPSDYQEKIAHIGLTQAAIYTKEAYGIKESIEEIIKEWNDAVIKEYSTSIFLKGYAKEFLDYLKNQGIKIGMATANSKSLYEPALINNHILDYFEYRVDVDVVKANKESSKIYDYIKDQMGLEASEIIVFEDILMACRTAKTNGYNVVAIFDLDSQKDQEEIKKYADKYIYDFSEMMK